MYNSHARQPDPHPEYLLEENLATELQGYEAQSTIASIVNEIMEPALQEFEDAITKSVKFFNNSSDWVNESPYFTLTVLATEHEKGSMPVINVHEEIAPGEFVIRYPVIIVLANGDFKIQVLEMPDERFTGKVIIS